MAVAAQAEESEDSETDAEPEMDWATAYALLRARQLIEAGLDGRYEHDANWPGVLQGVQGKQAKLAVLAAEIKKMPREQERWLKFEVDEAVVRLKNRIAGEEVQSEQIRRFAREGPPPSRCVICRREKAEHPEMPLANMPACPHGNWMHQECIDRWWRGSTKKRCPVCTKDAPLLNEIRF